MKASLRAIDRDFVRLFLRYDADVTMIDGFGRSVSVGAIEAPPYSCPRTVETSNRGVFQKAVFTECSS